MMKKQIILLVDTNKLFSSIRSRSTGGYWWKIWEVYTLTQKYTILVSVFVLLESQRILQQKANILLSAEDLKLFCHDLNITIVSSEQVKGNFNNYVKDDFDVQILYGAYYHNASIIFTNNLKDFHIQQIHNQFGITVTSHLEL